MKSVGLDRSKGEVELLDEVLSNPEYGLGSVIQEYGPAKLGSCLLRQVSEFDVTPELSQDIIVRFLLYLGKA
jgi:hypothetical protein